MDWIQIVSTLGFPIACCIAMGLYVKYQTDNNRADIRYMNEQHEKEMADVTQAINNNTIAINHLVDMLNSRKDG